MIPVPSVVLLLLGLAGPAVWGYMYVAGTIKEKAAYNQGISAGKAEVEAAQISAGQGDSQAIRDALANTPVPDTPKAIAALCQKDIACREHGALK